YVNESRGIIRSSGALRGTKTDLLGGPQSGFIQPVSQTSHYSLHPQLAGSGKHHFDQNFALDLQSPAFFRIGGLGFEKDLHGFGVGLFFGVRLSRGSGRSHLTETSLRDRSLARAVPGATSGDIAETGAGYCASCPARSSGTVAVPRTRWHTESAQARDHHRAFLVGGAAIPIGITEPAGLDLRGRFMQRCRFRGALSKRASHHIFLVVDRLRSVRRFGESSGDDLLFQLGTHNRRLHLD